MEKYLCLICKQPCKPYWVSGTELVENLPSIIVPGHIDAFARCHTCEESYLVVMDVRVLQVPRPKISH